MQVRAGSASLGRAIFLVGIIAQGASYLIFDALVVLSHRSIRRVMLMQGLDPHQGAWYKIFKLLYFSSFFIIVRCARHPLEFQPAATFTILRQVRSIYRIVETVQGIDGYLFTHECRYFAGLLAPHSDGPRRVGCFIAFDTIPLAFATAISAIYWPGNYIPKPGSATPIGIPMSDKNARVIEAV